MTYSFVQSENIFYVVKEFYHVGKRRFQSLVAVTQDLKFAREKLRQITNDGAEGFIQYSQGALKDSAQFFV